ncbi:FUSC family protein [Brachybacterium hainanense]|uniref:FUSC family protein n=1 Tax=Brachybacterium hainanense TaxID=1541174 RepID=A0ABV6R9S9_9MICO
MSVPADLRERARRLVSLAPGRVDHIPALRIAAGLAVPLAILLATDRVEWSMYASFGAFTGIYSRYEPTAQRFRRQSFIGLLLTACVGIGAVLASLGTPGGILGAGADAPAAVLAPGTLPWITMIVGALVAAFSAMEIARRGIRPGGALFPLFAVAAVASAPAAAPVQLAVLIAAGSAAWCVLLGLLGHYLGERHPGAGVAPPRERFAPGRLMRLGAGYFAAAVVAGAIGILSGLPFPYWAQIAAIVPLSAAGHGAQVERGVHRLIGTVLGIGVTAFLLSFPAQAWQLAVWVVLLQFLAELYVLRNYALALCFVTPLALLMVQMAHPQEAGPMLQARLGETAIGVGIGIVVVVIIAVAGRSAHRIRSTG